jgi:hypothetical protein
MLRLEYQLLPIEFGKECHIRSCRRIAGKVCNGRVGSENPAVFVRRESCRVIRVHFDEVLIETVIAADPAAKSVQEEATSEIDTCTYKPRPGLG